MVVYGQEGLGKDGIGHSMNQSNYEHYRHNNLTLLVVVEDGHAYHEEEVVPANNNQFCWFEVHVFIVLKLSIIHSNDSIKLINIMI